MYIIEFEFESVVYFMDNVWWYLLGFCVVGSGFLVELMVMNL